MNVGFEDFSTKDVAAMLKIDQHTVCDWCRKGRIRNRNLSDGDKSARYLIPEDEAEYLRKLFKKWGKTKAMRHYDVTRIEPVLVTSGVVGNYECENMPVVPEEDEMVVNEENEYSPIPQKVDPDKIAATISYIQDIKERLQDLEAEKNQLLNELEELREEVKSVL